VKKDEIVWVRESVVGRVKDLTLKRIEIGLEFILIAFEI
jgi:hypothetical protein